MMQRNELNPGFDAALRGTIVRIRDKYFLWSSIADAPLTVGLPRHEFVAWYIEQFKDGARQSRLEMRLARADKGGEIGTSSFIGDASDCIACNRAGPGETKLTVEEIYNLTA